jgi:hypothetical protein
MIIGSQILYFYLFSCVIASYKWWWTCRHMSMILRSIIWSTRMTSWVSKMIKCQERWGSRTQKGWALQELHGHSSREVSGQCLGKWQ